MLNAYATLKKAIVFNPAPANEGGYDLNTSFYNYNDANVYIVDGEFIKVIFNTYDTYKKTVSTTKLKKQYENDSFWTKTTYQGRVISLAQEGYLNHGIEAIRSALKNK